MTNYNAWTAATDTPEIRVDLRGPYFDRETTVIEFPWLQPAVTPTRLPRRLRLAATLRKTGAVLLLIAGLMALSAEPAAAHPVHDAPRYYGPTLTCWTADQLFPWAFDEEGCR